MKKYFAWLPMVCWMALIFALSSQPYSKQDIRPFLQESIPQTFVKEHLGDVKVYYSGNEISIKTKGVPGFLEFFVRKGAHVFVFMVLTITVQWAVQKTWKRGKGPFGYALSFFLPLVYAISDEWHQSITPNRTPKMEDVWIDMIGIMMGLVIMIVINRLGRVRTCPDVRQE